MSNRSTIRIISTISWCWASKGHSASSSSRLYANECWQDRRPKRAAANCSKGFRLGMPATPWIRSCFIPTDGSAKRYSSCSPSFENCGACVRHSNGFVITTWSYRSILYRERGFQLWSPIRMEGDEHRAGCPRGHRILRGVLRYRDLNQIRPITTVDRVYGVEHRNVDDRHFTRA